MSAIETPARAPSEQEIRAAVEAAGDRRGGLGIEPPASAMQDALNNWTFNLLQHGPWERWSCNDDHCPGRPQSDKALDQLFEDVTGSGLVQECIDLIEGRLAAAAAKFVADYPDAPRRKVEVAA